MRELIPEDRIARRILIIRGIKVMLDKDLAELYEVKPIVLRQQVKRNQERFPDDFMFRLTKEEAEFLVSQNVIASKKTLGGFLPYAFTEQGVAMLSSVLRSKRAIQVNIQIMRAFTMLRQMILGYKELQRKIKAMERKYDGQFRVVFKAIRQLMEPSPKPPKRLIGFHP